MHHSLQSRDERKRWHLGMENTATSWYYETVKRLYIQILRMVGDLEVVPLVAIAAEVSRSDGSEVGTACEYSYKHRLR